MSDKMEFYSGGVQTKRDLTVGSDKMYRGAQTKWNFTEGSIKIQFYRGYRQNGISQRDPDKMEFYRGSRQNGILQGVHLGSVGTFQFCLAVLLTVKFVKKEKSQVAVSFKGKKGTCVV